MVAPQPSPIATLFPGYFALVMATGIVAVASDQQNLDLLAEALYVITATAYIILAILLATRMIRYWSNFTADATRAMLPIDTFCCTDCHFMSVMKCGRVHQQPRVRALLAPWDVLRARYLAMALS